MSDLSRAISHALRHEPWLYELELDDEGWVNISALLAGLRRASLAWRNVTVEDVAEAVRFSSKRRHEIANGRIRALYGHSLPGKLCKMPAVPPAKLFHGTTPESALSIRRDGLRPMSRHYVHLSIDRNTALAVGKRKSADPIILEIEARKAWKAGVPFYTGNEKVWLGDYVPARFINFT